MLALPPGVLAIAGPIGEEAGAVLAGRAEEGGAVQVWVTEWGLQVLLGSELWTGWSRGPERGTWHGRASG